MEYRCKLLKDLPNVSAGTIFKTGYGFKELERVWTDIDDEPITLYKKDFPNFNEWFEEIDPFKYYYINDNGEIDEGKTWDEYGIESYSHVRFETKEEARKHLRWLKAREVLLEDSCNYKGGIFKVAYDYINGLHVVNVLYTINEVSFETEEEAKKSIKRHSKEWEIYLGVE